MLGIKDTRCLQRVPRHLRLLSERVHSTPRVRKEEYTVRHNARHIYHVVTNGMSAACLNEAALVHWREPLLPDQSTTGAVIALGKFDAMHKGHRFLAATAASIGHPVLVSFVGMAEVLNWPKRLPLVAPSDRERVLGLWTGHCHGMTPLERFIPFAEVRTMSPEDFVKVLVNELKIAGVVVGENYRFGYKASGTTDTLKALGEQYGFKVQIMHLVAQEEGVEEVSSSQVRKSLADGDMSHVATLLERPYYFIAAASTPQQVTTDSLRIETSAFQNQPPKNGTYSVNIVLRLCTTSNDSGLRPVTCGSVTFDDEGATVRASSLTIPAGNAYIELEFAGDS